MKETCSGVRRRCKWGGMTFGLPGIKEARSNGSFTTMHSLRMRPSKYAPISRSEYYYEDGWYVLYEGRKPIKKKVMNQNQADALNDKLNGSKYVWTRVDNSVAAKVNWS